MQCGLLGISGVTNDMKVLLQELLPISPDNAVSKAESRQLFQECQVAGSRVGHPPEVPLTDEASFRQDSIWCATW